MKEEECERKKNNINPVLPYNLISTVFHDEKHFVQWSFTFTPIPTFFHKRYKVKDMVGNDLRERKRALKEQQISPSKNHEKKFFFFSFYCEVKTRKPKNNKSRFRAVAEKHNRNQM